MTAVRGAGVILFRRCGEGVRFLLLKNALHGSWGFPKGHARPEEELEACARREAREETGGLPFRLLPGFLRRVRYRVHLEKPREEGKTYLKEVTLFLGEAGEGEVRISREHSEFRWVGHDEGKALLRHADLVGILGEAALRIGLPEPG